MSDRIQLRRDSAAVWTLVNPTLAQGEVGVETDTHKLKLGDGITPWNDLGYFLYIPPGLEDADMTDLVDGSVLVFRSSTQKFTATTLLNQQSVDAGEF